jgi:hypothetical protein
MENGMCIIGMKSVAMIPLISFDAVVNIYLTILFLIPLKSKPLCERTGANGNRQLTCDTIDLYSFKNMQNTPANLRLRSVAFRTFLGAVATLISSIV